MFNSLQVDWFDYSVEHCNAILVSWPELFICHLQVKIAVKSTSYNPADSKIRAGSFGPVALPKVSGGDVAGVVVETDPGSEYKSGDPVIAMSAAFMPSNPNGEIESDIISKHVCSCVNVQTLAPRSGNPTTCLSSVCEWHGYRLGATVFCQQSCRAQNDCTLSWALLSRGLVVCPVIGFLEHYSSAPNVEILDCCKFWLEVTACFLSRSCWSKIEVIGAFALACFSWQQGVMKASIPLSVQCPFTAFFPTVVSEKKSVMLIAESDTGSWAEYTVLPENTLVRLPKNLSLDTEAGALPVVSLTAFQGLEKAKIQKGDRVLVHAGSGGVGHIAVQLAKHHWGAYVVSTSRYVDLVKVSCLYDYLSWYEAATINFLISDLWSECEHL